MIDLFIFAIIGVFAGASAGVLGLGGGLVTVPALLFVFKAQGLPDEHLMHIAVSTSLMTIIVTSLSSMLAHHKNQNVDWGIVRNLLVGLSLGGFIGAFFATLFSSTLLQKMFATYAFVMSVRLWIPLSVSGVSTRLLRRPYLMVTGTFVGSISALVGMGGGTMVVPYLVLARQTIQRAIGTSAACGFPIAVAAVAGFIIFGEEQWAMEQWQTGYIHWKAFFGVISTSILFAPLAAKLANDLPVVRLRQIFSIVLMLVSLDLFFN